jgi:hypothetical protein
VGIPTLRLVWDYLAIRNYCFVWNFAEFYGEIPGYLWQGCRRFWDSAIRLRDADRGSIVDWRLYWLVKYGDRLSVGTIWIRWAEALRVELGGGQDADGIVEVLLVAISENFTRNARQEL